MKRKHQRSIAYLVIALLGISLWHLWKSSKIAENPAYTKGVVMENMKVCILVILSPFIIKKVTPVTVKLT